MQDARMSSTPAHGPCPCGRLGAKRQPLAYEDCCGRWHRGAPAPDAEALMRSRYSAYVMRTPSPTLTDYLLATWHPSTRPATLLPDEPGLKWLGLEVRRHTVQDADHATVEFVARSKLGGRALRLHETSRFVREPAGPGAEGRWFYLDGEMRHPTTL